jgi:hypothetical protein
MTSITESKTRRGPLLDYLDAIEDQCGRGDPRLGDLVRIFGADGHYVLTLFLLIPFLQPVPLMGLSGPFGLFIGFISILAYLGYPPFLPKRWSQKSLPASTVLKIAEGSERVFEKIRFLIRSRWPLFFSGPFVALNTSVIVLNAILLALPLPIPFSNAIPAWGILFQTIAQLEDDGFFVALSYLQTLLCVVFFTLLAVGAATGMEYFLATP